MRLLVHIDSNFQTLAVCLVFFFMISGDITLYATLSLTTSNAKFVDLSLQIKDLLGVIHNYCPHFLMTFHMNLIVHQVFEQSVVSAV